MDGWDFLIVENKFTYYHGRRFNFEYYFRICIIKHMPRKWWWIEESYAYCDISSRCISAQTSTSVWTKRTLFRQKVKRKQKQNKAYALTENSSWLSNALIHLLMQERRTNKQCLIKTVDKKKLSVFYSLNNCTVQSVEAQNISSTLISCK